MLDLFRVRQHCSQDSVGPRGDDDLRNVRDAHLPHVGEPDGHVPRAAFHLSLPQHLLRNVQEGEEEEGHRNKDEEDGTGKRLATIGKYSRIVPLPGSSYIFLLLFGTTARNTYGVL
jgi:hypothetical protein